MITLRQHANNPLVSDAVNYFLSTYKENTARPYKCAFKKIFEIQQLKGIFHPFLTLEEFSKLNPSTILDLIKKHVAGGEATRQARCAAFIAFTKFLSRHTNGTIQAAIPQRGSTPTFQKIREKSTCIAMTAAQCTRFIRTLHAISVRDYLIAKCVLQGAKRIGEVLSARVEQIDWENNRIHYKQFKSSILEKITSITYPADFMQELKTYLNERSQGHIFITRNAQPVTQPHFYRSVAHAGVEAGIPFRVHPHSLRATAITLLMQMGYHYEQILVISGHASTKEVMYYDKTPIEQNISQEFRLI